MRNQLAVDRKTSVVCSVTTVQSIALYGSIECVSQNIDSNDVNIHLTNIIKI